MNNARVAASPRVGGLDSPATICRGLVETARRSGLTPARRLRKKRRSGAHVP
jgi:hypothetical protein